MALNDALCLARELIDSSHNTLDQAVAAFDTEFRTTLKQSSEIRDKGPTAQPPARHNSCTISGILLVD